MTLEERLAAVEARQWAYEMHDPDCPVFVREMAQKYTDSYLAPVDCSCWLAAGAAP